MTLLFHPSHSGLEFPPSVIADHITLPAEQEFQWTVSELWLLPSRICACCNLSCGKGVVPVGLQVSSFLFLYSFTQILPVASALWCGFFPLLLLQSAEVTSHDMRIKLLEAFQKRVQKGVPPEKQSPFGNWSHCTSCLAPFSCFPQTLFQERWKRNPLNPKPQIDKEQGRAKRKRKKKKAETIVWRSVNKSNGLKWPAQSLAGSRHCSSTALK